MRGSHVPSRKYGGAGAACSITEADATAGAGATCAITDAGAQLVMAFACATCLITEAGALVAARPNLQN